MLNQFLLVDVPFRVAFADDNSNSPVAYNQNTAADEGVMRVPADRTCS